MSRQWGVEQNITHCRVPKPIAIQDLLDWLYEPMVISPDNIITLDVRAPWAIKDETRGDGKLCKTFATHVQHCQFWTLRLPVTGFCGTDPVAAIDEYSVEGQAE